MSRYGLLDRQRNSLRPFQNFSLASFLKGFSCLVRISKFFIYRWPTNSECHNLIAFRSSRSSSILENVLHWPESSSFMALATAFLAVFGNSRGSKLSLGSIGLISALIIVISIVFTKYCPLFVIAIMALSSI